MFSPHGFSDHHWIIFFTYNPFRLLSPFDSSVRGPPSKVVILAHASSKIFFLGAVTMCSQFIPPFTTPPFKPKIPSEGSSLQRPLTLYFPLVLSLLTRSEDSTSTPPRHTPLSGYFYRPHHPSVDCPRHRATLRQRPPGARRSLTGAGDQFWVSMAHRFPWLCMGSGRGWGCLTNEQFFFGHQISPSIDSPASAPATLRSAPAPSQVRPRPKHDRHFTMLISEIFMTSPAKRPWFCN